MKKILIILILLCSIGVKAQTIKTSPLDINTNIVYTFTERKPDTVQVLAYCIDNFDTPTFSWRKLYAVYGWDFPSINLNDLVIYKKYLMPDRKAPVTFKVVYAIKKP